jgi:two-component system sensor histidine kinase ChvG
MFRLRSSLFRVLTFSVIATAVLSLFFAATISRPLARITRAAERIAAGDRTAAPEQTRRDEIGQLARAVDVMTHRLDDRARAVAELAADLSHELKSPLTSIRGAAELLIDGADADPEARTRFLDNILADANRLDRLVTRLLELSRAEADPSEPEPIDWEELVREGAGAGAIVVYAATRTGVHGRRGPLLSAVRNLVENARQHAEPGSVVTVRVEDAEPGVATHVHNHGSAIRPANLARVWGRFFTTRAARGGTGLGLAIVKTVVLAHGGTVAVTSTPEAGTTFSIVLPTPPPE